MAFLQVKNRAKSKLASDITADATTLSVLSGDGNKFPDSNFIITVCVAGSPETNIERMLCTSRSDDTLTVQRHYGGTTAVAHNAGELVELRYAAEIIDEIHNSLDTKLANVVDDSAPKLGGDLDMNGHKIGGNSETDLDDAVSKKHSQNTDTGTSASEFYVDTGGDNVPVKSHIQNTSNPHNVTASQVGAITEVKDDTTPQLGGDLDLQTHKIVGEGGTKGIYINSSGNVGIGTTGPSDKLDVNGNIKSTYSMVYVPSIDDYVTTQSFKKAVYHEPHVKVVNVDDTKGPDFPNPTIWSENEWDWEANGDVWTNPVPPSGFDKVYARITISLYNPSNHYPCLWLRREFYNTDTSAWEKMSGDPDIYLGCLKFSKRKFHPASATVWVPWWNTSLTKMSHGGSTQRLLISAESSWNGDAAGSITWVIYGAEVELYASNTNVSQDFVYGGTSSGTPGDNSLIFFPGNVGIGTTNPGYKLDVNGDANANRFCINGDCINSWGATGVQGSGTTNYVAKFTGSGTIGNSSIFDNGTNVGIGTTNPTAPLSVVAASSGDQALSQKWQYTSSDNYNLRLKQTVTSGVVRWTFDQKNNGVDYPNVITLDRGNVGIGTTSPGAKLDINSDIIRLRNSKTPSSATDTGNKGDIAWDSNYIYVCVDTNTWKRAALSSW